VTLKKIGGIKYFIFLIFSALFSTLIFSCASTPKQSQTNGGLVSGKFTGNPDEKTAINHQASEEKKNRNYTYFSAIPESIMKDVEVGSPSSLRRAIQAIRKQNSELTENEKVLIAVESNIMQMVWTNERVDWESPDVSQGNSYLGAINSAKNGIYDTSTGNVDFLTIVLPSLVVTKVSDVSPFFSDSEFALKKGLQLCPESVLASYLLGILYRKNLMYEKAVEQFRDAAKKAPEIFQVLYAYAESLYLSGNEHEAEIQVNSLLEKYPSDMGVLKLGAQIYFLKKDYAKSETYISRVLQQEPNDLESVLFRAKILIQKKDYIHAASLLDVYSRQDNSSKEYLLLRSQIQFEWSKNNTAAVATIETALKNYPGDKDVLLYAARISSATGLPVAGQSAEYYANQVLSVAPQEKAALFYATEGFIRKKEWQKAYDTSSRLINEPDSDMETLFNHVEICLALKRYDEAWNLVSQAYRQFPSDENVVQAYISVMVASGRSAQALSLINQQIDSAGAKLKSFLYYQRSFLRDSESMSLSDLRSSLIANPRNSDALFRLYEIYYAKNDYRKAQYYLKQVVALNPNDPELRTLNEKLNSLIR
jgi:tetratricopeptide (TPR) repeat protein